ncbi:MAG: hypothetical protein ICV63_09310 [Coleofasciculus sp. Co-bin14]|nr:hypothetical protein [Coleofasciculus sp. Co-bin14]
MSRLLYEKSVSYKGHLIIPFIFGVADGESIYSYKLLSELGHKGKFHKAENPARICSNSIEIIIDIAKEHLDKNLDIRTEIDYFKCRYTYRYNLIVIHEAAGKYFYDHYKPEDLNNVAAPKLFNSEYECISWIKQGLDRSSITTT